MTYQINNHCIGCGACARKCPEGAIDGEPKVRFHIDAFLCLGCGTCFQICRQGAIVDPAGRCSPRKQKKGSVSKARIDVATCAGCRACYLNCPQNAIVSVKKGFFSILYCQVNADLCAGCGICTQLCITGAVSLI